MKYPRINRKRFLLNITAFIIGVFLVFNAGVAIGSSNSEGHDTSNETTGWVKTDWYRVMNFAVLAAVLFFLLRKPVSQALNGRIKGIQNQLRDLETKKKEAGKKLAEYNERIADLDRKAKKIVAEYVRQGEEAKQRILKEAENAAAKLEEQARRNIEHEFKTAKLELQEDIFEKALVKAEKIVKEKITSKDQNRLVDEYLDKVEA